MSPTPQSAVEPRLSDAPRPLHRASTPSPGRIVSRSAGSRLRRKSGLASLVWMIAALALTLLGSVTMSAPLSYAVGAHPAPQRPFPAEEATKLTLSAKMEDDLKTVAISGNLATASAYLAGATIQIQVANLAPVTIQTDSNGSFSTRLDLLSKPQEGTITVTATFAAIGGYSGAQATTTVKVESPFQPEIRASLSGSTFDPGGTVAVTGRVVSKSMSGELQGTLSSNDQVWFSVPVASDGSFSGELSLPLDSAAGDNRINLVYVNGYGQEESRTSLSFTVTTATPTPTPSASSTPEVSPSPEPSSSSSAAASSMMTGVDDDPRPGSGFSWMFPTAIVVITLIGVLIVTGMLRRKWGLASDGPTLMFGSDPHQDRVNIDDLLSEDSTSSR